MAKGDAYCLMVGRPEEEWQNCPASDRRYFDRMCLDETLKDVTSRLKQTEQKLAEREARRVQEERSRSWNEKAEAARAKYEDFDEALHLAAKGRGSLVGSVITKAPALAAQAVMHAGAFHGRIHVLDREAAKESTGHGSPLPTGGALILTPAGHNSPTDLPIRARGDPHVRNAKPESRSRRSGDAVLPGRSLAAAAPDGALGLYREGDLPARADLERLGCL